jgi:hypothetical protein
LERQSPLWPDQLPTEASNVAYRIALAAADEEKATKTVEKAYELGKGRFENTKTRDEVSKETEEDLFLAKIKDTYKSGIDTVDKSLRSLSDLDLGLVYLAHDVDRLTTEHFVTEVDRLLTEYKNEVEVIGDGGTVFHPWQSTLRYILLPSFRIVSYVLDARILGSVSGRARRKHRLPPLELLPTRLRRRPARIGSNPPAGAGRRIASESILGILTGATGCQNMGESTQGVRWRSR